MNRRQFNAYGLLGLSATTLPATAWVGATPEDWRERIGDQFSSDRGLKLRLQSVDNATADADAKQFILTFSRHGGTAVTTDGIHRLTDAAGQSTDVFLGALPDGTYQAVFNRRTRE